MLEIPAVVTGEPGRLGPSEMAAESPFAVVCLVTVGGLIGYTCPTWLILRAPVTTVATRSHVNPIVAVSLVSAPLAVRASRRRS